MDTLTRNGYLDINVFKEEVKHAVQKCKRGASPSLLKEMQKYIQGDLIYIPKAKKERAAWGEVSGSRELIAKRNEEIFQLYNEGNSFEELEKKFHLSFDTIRKIIYKMRKNYK